MKRAYGGLAQTYRALDLPTKLESDPSLSEIGETRDCTGTVQASREAKPGIDFSKTFKLPNIQNEKYSSFMKSKKTQKMGKSLSMARIPRPQSPQIEEVKFAPKKAPKMVRIFKKSDLQVKQEVTSLPKFNYAGSRNKVDR